MAGNSKENGGVSYMALALIGAIVLIAWTMKTYKMGKESFDNASGVLGDIVLGNASDLGDVSALTSRILNFIPRAGALYNVDKSVVIAPDAGATWILDYNNHLRRALSACVENILTPPNTLVICCGANFGKGRVVFIPVNEEGVVNGGVLYSELLKNAASNFVFSCVVPAGWVARFKYEGIVNTQDLQEGVHASVMAPGSIKEISLISKKSK